MELRELLDDFVMKSKNILRSNLTGIYLHGSAAMGCFNDRTSDVDLLVVVKDNISNEIKRQYMDMVVLLNREAPSKGLELSVVKEAVCKPRAGLERGRHRHARGRAHAAAPLGR